MATIEVREINSPGARHYRAYCSEHGWVTDTPVFFTRSAAQRHESVHIYRMHDGPPIDLVLPDGQRHAGRYQFDADGEPIVVTAECGACHFRWNDALITTLTPTPSARCPNEYGHAY